MQITRSGTMVKFLDIMIGNAFFYGGRFYVRTDYKTAMETKGTGWKDGRVGNFVMDEMKDELMEEVTVTLAK